MPYLLKLLRFFNLKSLLVFALALVFLYLYFLNKRVHNYKKELLESKKELNALKDSYRKNIELEKKLSAVKSSTRVYKKEVLKKQEELKKELEKRGKIDEQGSDFITFTF